MYKLVLIFILISISINYSYTQIEKRVSNLPSEILKYFKNENKIINVIDSMFVHEIDYEELSHLQLPVTDEAKNGEFYTVYYHIGEFIFKISFIQVENHIYTNNKEFYTYSYTEKIGREVLKINKESIILEMTKKGRLIKNVKFTNPYIENNNRIEQGVYDDKFLDGKKINFYVSAGFFSNSNNYLVLNNIREKFIDINKINLESDKYQTYIYVRSDDVFGKINKQVDMSIERSRLILFNPVTGKFTYDSILSKETNMEEDFHFQK